jgi:ribose transport system substrate-binding protein
MKKIIVRAAVIFLLVSLISLAGAAQDAKPSGRLLVASFMTMHDAFFVELGEGFKQAVEAHGDHLLLLDGQHSREKQEKDVLEALKLRPAAIFLVPATDSGSIDGILTAAKAQGVPVIIADTDIDVSDSMIVTKVLNDNYAAGYVAGKELVRVHPQARIGILSFSSSKGCVERVKGFTDAIANEPGMQIVDTQDGHANRDGVRGVIKEFLAAHPDMNVVFAINDVSAIEALSGIEAAGRAGKISILDVGGSPEAISLIKDGKLLSTSAQFPKEIAKVAVDSVYAFLDGKHVEKVIRVPVKLITKTNANGF